MTKITPEGEVDIESFRTEIIAELIKDKKAAYIQEKYAANTTLESLAKATDREVETASAVNPEEYCFSRIWDRTLRYRIGVFIRC